MTSPATSLLKYNHPILISKTTGRKSPSGRRLRASGQPAPPKGKPTHTDASNQETEQILNTIFPPRYRSSHLQEWMEGIELMRQHVSSAACTTADVVHLEEMLDISLQQKQARETGICPVRRELYTQFFDELIRQVTISCAERGLLLMRFRDEIQMTIAAYQTMYESSMAFSMKKKLQAEQDMTDMNKRISELEAEKTELKKQLKEQIAKCDIIEKRENEKRLADEKRYTEEIEFLKTANQQLKAQLEGIITPKK
uniref:Axonemal dynein light intermediate polypeptide 1 n=1 Tax=Mola mola TaxID=94237 RepID=A0A3Q3VW81_MOLML